MSGYGFETGTEVRDGVSCTKFKFECLPRTRNVPGCNDIARAHAQGQPLQALFARVQALFAQAESGSQPAAEEAAGLLRHCTDAVDRLALFSRYSVQ